VDSCLRFIIPSDFAESRQVQSRILEELQRYDYAPDAIFAIKLALEEAIINAIKHGNKFDPAKVVRIEAHVSPQQTEIIIEDEGAGFERSSVPDPTADENLHSLHGRGLLLMESYMNEVNYSRGGRRIRLVRRNNGHGQQQRSGD